MLESYTIRPPKWPFYGQCAEVETVAVSTRPRCIAKHLTADRHACYIPVRGNSIFRSVPRKSAVFDSTIGRWQSKDPKSFDAGDTNLYRYVGNHPSYATDPSGLQDPEKASIHSLRNPGDDGWHTPSGQRMFYASDLISFGRQLER
jgi:hypothetical protein